MPDTLRLRLLEREVELMGHFALIVAEDLDRAAQANETDELPVLLQALVATALKISHLLWPFGRRVTDQVSVDEAAAIRSRLALNSSFPLAPANVVPLVPCLTMPRAELLEAIDLEHRALRLDGELYPVEPLVDAIRAVHGAVVART